VKGKRLFFSGITSPLTLLFIIPSPPHYRGLENNLKLNRFKIEGNLHSFDQNRILSEFFSNLSVQEHLGLSAAVDSPSPQVNQSELKTTVRSMDFFDRLTTEGFLPADLSIDSDLRTGIVGASGTIMGCFDETFDGITVSGESLTHSLTMFFLSRFLIV
jgi:hypothetical protein